MLRILLLECSLCLSDVVFSCVVFLCNHVAFVRITLVMGHLLSSGH